MAKVSFARVFRCAEVGCLRLRAALKAHDDSVRRDDEWGCSGAVWGLVGPHKPGSFWWSLILKRWGVRTSFAIPLHWWHTCTHTVCSSRLIIMLVIFFSVCENYIFQRMSLSWFTPTAPNSLLSGFFDLSGSRSKAGKVARLVILVTLCKLHLKIKSLACCCQRRLDQRVLQHSNF